MKDSKWKAIWTSCVLRHNIQPFNFNLVNLRRVGWWRWGHQCQAPCVKKDNHSHSSSRGDCCDCPFLLSCKSQWHWLIRKNMETTFCFRATPQHAIRICSRERSGYYQVLHARRSTRCGQCPEKLMYHAPVWTQQATCPVHTGLGFACCCRGLALDSGKWTLEQQRPFQCVIGPSFVASESRVGREVHTGVWQCVVHRVLRLGFACCCRGLALDSGKWTLEQQRPLLCVILASFVASESRVGRVGWWRWFCLAGRPHSHLEIEQLMTCHLESFKFKSCLSIYAKPDFTLKDSKWTGLWTLEQ